MKQRGRQSASALAVVPLPTVGRSRVSPPPHLTAEESALFKQILSECHPDQFVRSDTILLGSFCQATILVRNLAKGLARSPEPKAIQSWERAVKAQAMLATRLRLAPQSRLGTRTAGRIAARHAPSAYDLMTETSHDDD